jgi:peptidoglycan/LPS O-acetylase OafA/YrhL
MPDPASGIISATAHVSGRTQNNFDLLRLIAAALVLISHAYEIRGIGGEEPLIKISSGHYSLSGIGLLIFFTISGYLVSKSLDETPSVKIFLFKRFLRIWPALIINILFTVLIIALFFSGMKFSDFLIDPQTLKYLLVNATLVKSVLWLPGAFQGRPVNISQWTIPVEVRLYIFLLVMYGIGIFRRKYLMLLVWSGCILILICIYHKFSFTNGVPKPFIWDSNLILFFLSGSVAYIFRQKIKFNRNSWLMLFVIWLVLIKLLPDYKFVFDIPFFTYSILFIATGMYVFPFVNTDLSYGIYLYGYPVQMGVQAILGNQLGLMPCLFLSAIITVLLAIASWNLVEKRAMSLKTLLKSPPTQFKNNTNTR